MTVPGTRLGPYEIVAPIGMGGMAEVFKAVDTRLGRNVAIKIFRDEFATDVKHRLRFEREAKTISQLEHPHICRLYDVGENYLVMELLEGESLRTALTESAIPPAKACEYAIQIAEALAAAHERGIIHRDLKPENIFITSEGRVKILDFGLATRAAVDGSDGPLQRDTAPGTVLGTVGYMSPEQARGRMVDHRADIFAFGAILYEMLSGQRAFGGETAADTMKAILFSQPPDLDVDASPLLPALNEIVRHSLEKNPNERFQSARDLAFDLRTLTTATSAPHRTVSSRSFSPRTFLVPAAVLFLGAGLGWTVSTLLGRTPTATPQRRSLTQLTFQSGIERFPSVSPDGKTFVYVSEAAGNSDIYLQRVEGWNTINLTGDSPAADVQPAFSADGKEIAFRSERDGGGIFTMGATGESVRRLTDFGHNPSWSPDGSEIVFSSEIVDLGPRGRGASGGLWIVNVKTAKVRLLTSRDAVQPSWSPHGDRIAFWSMSTRGGGQRDVLTIAARAPRPDETIVAVTNDAPLDWSPFWSGNGQWLYFGSDRDGTLNLWRMAIDEKSGKVSGAPQPLNLPAEFSAHFSAAREVGAIAFAVVTSTESILRYSLEAPLAAPPVTVLSGTLPLFFFDVSPDGKQIAYSTAGAQEDIFVINSDGSNFRQITDDPDKDRGPAWSPDGRQIYFYSQRGERYETYAAKADGSGLTQVTRTSGSSFWYPRPSPDGSRILVFNAKGSAIWNVSTSRLEPLLQPDPKHVVTSPVWSPDGRRIAAIRQNPDSAARDAVVVYSMASKRYESVIEIPADAVRWTRDGKHLVCSRLDGSLVMIDPATKEVRDLGIGAPTGVRRNRSSATFSVTDDSIYVLSSRTESDIWLVR